MKLSIAVALILLAGCASQSVKVLDATWVSMKHAEPPTEAQKLVRQVAIQERYCQKSWNGSYGLMDEVVKQAEAKNQIDYIKHASFSEDRRHNCMDLTGEGYRIVQ